MSRCTIKMHILMYCNNSVHLSTTCTVHATYMYQWKFCLHKKKLLNCS